MSNVDKSHPTDRVDKSREAEIDAFIATLSESDLRRILAILEYGEHKCHGARIGCCGVFRCEPCHVTHLRYRHGEKSAQFWNKLCQESRSTWNSNQVIANGDSSLPVSKKSSTHRKVAKLKKVNDPSAYKPVTIEEEIQAALDNMNRIIKLKEESNR